MRLCGPCADTVTRGCRPDLAAGENKLPTEFMYGNASFPKEVDWRKKGAVTPVKNQQQVAPSLQGSSALLQTRVCGRSGLACFCLNMQPYISTEATQAQTPLRSLQPTLWHRQQDAFHSPAGPLRHNSHCMHCNP